jgi:hypothetical protein
MGKTTFGLRYVNGSPHHRVFVFDPEQEFAARFQVPDEQIARSIESVFEIAERRRIVVYDPQVEYPGQNAEAFDEFCQVVFEIARDGFCPRGIASLMVTDELQKYVNNVFAPQSFRTILETGRRQMLDTFSMSRSPNRLHPGIREEFTELVLFRLDDENSLKFAQGVGADVAQVQALNPHEYLYYNVLFGGTRRGKLEFARKGTN